MNRMYRVSRDEGNRTALLVGTGRKFEQWIWIEDSGVKIHKHPIGELKREPMSAESFLGNDIKPICKRYIEAGKSLGITASALSALEGIKDAC